MDNNIFSKVKNNVCVESVIMDLLPQGQREGKNWVALNPTRDDNQIGSFKVNLSTGQFYDFANHDRGGDIISLYAYLNGVSQYEAAQYLLGNSEFSKNLNLTITPPKAPKPPKVSTKQYIYKLWDETFSIKDSIVEEYLAKRKLLIQNTPKYIRYHSNLYHKPRTRYFRAMISAITRYGSDEIIGLHRTYLEGQDKASIKPNKMILGEAKGGAVRFGDIAPRLIIAEGIETALSIYQATKISTWACLSTSGLINVVLPPKSITPNIIIAADNDKAGNVAVSKLSRLLLENGYKVNIAFPPINKDFNDLLQEEL